MVIYILILWILIKLAAPAWAYIVLGLGFTLKCVKDGWELSEALKK